jgi:uncharacterized protein (TIGR00369 family)
MTQDRDVALTRLREEMARPPFHSILQPQAVAADPEDGSVTISLAFRDELARAPGEKAFHGGVIATLIDLAGHAAAAVQVGRMTPTIDLRIDYLRAADGGDLLAHARLLKAGRTVARVDISVTDSKGRLVAVGRGTFSTA